MNISEKAKQQVESCRFCWMCRHVCPIGNADGQERNNARARALMISYVLRGTEKLEDAADNIYECTLCGACTNNCKTGWDPKIFISEVRTELVLSGKAPSYIKALLKRYFDKKTIFSGEPADIYGRVEGKDALVHFGLSAVYNDQETVKKALSLLKNVSTNKEAEDSGYILYFLTGKTKETVEQAEKCAKELNKYKEVVVYNPVELSFMLHQFKEWGIEIKAKLVSFNEKLLELKLPVKKGNKEYTLQDNYAATRELDDLESGRKLIELVGVNKEMLLIHKEANMAGNLIMNEYMHDKIMDVARNRWNNAINMGCKTIVTTNPDEHVMLKKTTPEGYRVITIEEMLIENM